MDPTEQTDTTESLHITQHGLGELSKKMAPVLRPHRGRLLLSLAIISLAGAAYGVMPLFPKFLIDQAIPNRNFGLAAIIALLFVLAQLARMSLWYLAMRLLLLIQEQITFTLRSMGFAHLQRLSLRFHTQYSSGYLYQTVFGSAIGAVAGSMQTIFKQLSLYIMAMLFSLICCLYLSVTMTGVILLGCVGYVVIGRALTPRIYSRSRDSLEAQNQIGQLIIDRLRGARTIQAMAIEDSVQSDLENKLWPAQLKSLDAIRERFRLGILSESAGYVVTAAIMIAGAYSIFYRDLSVGDLIAFMGYQATLITIVSTLTTIYGDFGATRAGMDQLFTILDTPGQVPEKPDAALPATVRGRLDFREVNFSYRDDSPLIQSLTLSVPPGQTVALVGRSGSGKTTLVNLLLRFYDPSGGAIQLDGVDIRDLPLRGYRSLYGVVLQDPFLFNESIRANMLHAYADATDEQIYEALRGACAFEFVKQLPGGLDFQVGEGGNRLSGGQRQRLAIARCMLLESRFVILDEPTSALDVESEHAVQAAFDKLFNSRTVFIIAHRLSTIRRADRILVLDQGRVVQDGSWSQLLAQGGLFREFYRKAMMTDDETVHPHSTDGRPATVPQTS